MNAHDIAKEVLAVLGTGRQLSPFSKVYPDFGLKEAYPRPQRPFATCKGKRAESVRSAARSVSTNRTIWAGIANGVYAPIWGYVCTTAPWATSTRWSRLKVSLLGLAEPRIEPEIVFGLAAPPRARQWTEQALIRCIGAGSPTALRLCRSVFPDWSFQALNCTVAAFACLRTALYRTTPFGSIAARWIGARLTLALRSRPFP